MGKSGNIVLVGFMGSGKSSVGQKLSEILGKQFIETDQLIEEDVGLKVRDIFERFGDGRFREHERKVIASLAAGEHINNPEGAVIATGGGEIVDERNFANLKRTGTLVWLKAPLVTILERISYGTTRALLDNVTGEESVVALVRKREPYYSQSELTVDTSEASADAVAQQIADHFNG